MSTIGKDIQDQVNTGREKIERSLGEIREMDVRQMPPGAFVVGAVMVGALALGAGWMLFHRRKRRPIVQRVQDVLPEGVKDLPGGLRDQIKRVL